MNRFFDSLCHKIFEFLDPEHKCNKKEELQIYFAIQTIALNISATLLILFLSYVAGSYKETFFLLCIFGMLRTIAGGFHFDNILKCIISTSFLIVAEGKLAQMIHINLYTCLIICLFTNLIFFFYVPNGTANNPYSEAYSQLQQKRLKITSIILTLSAICFVQIRTIVLLAMLTVAVLLLPNTTNTK